MAQKKVKNLKKNKRLLAFSIGIVCMIGFSATTGVFINDSVSNSDDSQNTLIQQTRKYATSVNDNSLSNYWSEVPSVSLLDSKISLENFINQNGAIFKNITNSEDYIATSTINELVSTEKTINYMDSADNRDKIANVYKDTVRSAADKVYEYGTKDISDAREYISRMNTMNNIYKEFKTRYVDDYGQALNIWSNPEHLKYDDNSPLFDAPSEDYAKKLTPVYLRENYRETYVDKFAGTYANALYNGSRQAIGTMIASLGSIKGDTEDEYDYAKLQDIADKAYEVPDDVFPAVMLLGNNDLDFAKDLVETARRYLGTAVKKHVEKQNTLNGAYMAMEAGLFGLIGGAIAVGELEPSAANRRTSGDYVDMFWHNKGMTLKYLYDQTFTDGETIKSLDEDVPVVLGTLTEINDKFKKVFDENTVNGNQAQYNVRHFLERGKEFTTWASNKYGLQLGTKTAKTDLEFLTDVFFDKIEEKWRDEINRRKQQNNMYYYDDFISTSVVDFMNGKGEKLFNLALGGYFRDIMRKGQDSLDKNGSFHKDNGNTILNYKTKEARADALKTLKTTYSEDNKKEVFSKAIDKFWSKYSFELDTIVSKSLSENQQDAQAEFTKNKQIMTDYLVTPYNSENFVVHNYTTDLLNQKSIPKLDENGNTVNFSFIPENSTKNSPNGFDENAADIVNGYLTKNKVLLSFLEKSSELPQLLKSKSSAALNAFSNSLFKILQTGVVEELLPVFNKYSTQSLNLLEDYILKNKTAVDRRLTKSEYSKYDRQVLLASQIRTEQLMDIKLDKVDLAEGFLLTIYNVKKYGDPLGEYQTIFEMIDNSEALSNYITEKSVEIAKS